MAIVLIPDLAGCMAGGATPAEALVALEEVKALWFEVSLERGHPIPEPESSGALVIDIRRRSND